MDQIPVIIISDAWMLIKSQSLSSSRILGHGSNPNNHHQGWLKKHATGLISIIISYYLLDYLYILILMVIGILSMSKHSWWWLLRFDPHTSILDDNDWDLIHVQASLMMMIGIWSMPKHPWWWLLEFISCSSILDDNFIDFSHLRKNLVVVSLGLVRIWMYSNVK